MCHENEPQISLWFIFVIYPPHLPLLTTLTPHLCNSELISWIVQRRNNSNVEFDGQWGREPQLTPDVLYSFHHHLRPSHLLRPQTHMATQKWAPPSWGMWGRQPAVESMGPNTSTLPMPRSQPELQHTIMWALTWHWIEQQWGLTRYRLSEWWGGWYNTSIMTTTSRCANLASTWGAQGQSMQPNCSKDQMMMMMATSTSTTTTEHDDEDDEENGGDMIPTSMMAMMRCSDGK